MQEDKPMKKAFQRIIPILTAVILSLCLALPAFAREINTNRLSLEMKNAPEGTAIIEILVPSEPADDCLCETRDFTVKKKISHYETTQLSDSSGSRPNYSFKSKEDKDIVISKDSEIAKYSDDDGYISLSAHTDGVVETTLNVNTYDDTKAEKNNGIYLQIADKNPASLADINALKSKFEKFKAAYIDEKGNVLGVTDEFEVTYADEQYAFKADGNKLTLVMNNYTETVKSTLFISFGFPVIIFIAVLIAVFAAALLFCLLAAKKNQAMMNDMDDDL